MPAIMADHDIEGQMHVLLRLLTSNRNQESPESLEATIQIATTPESLPVLTIGEPNAFSVVEPMRNVWLSV